MLDEIRARILKIRRGQVMTYGEVAEAAGFPGAARQVVWALQSGDAGVPWHRVVGAGLKIKLPGEAGLEQALRLQQEGWDVIRGRLQKRSGQSSSEKDLRPELNPPRAARRKNRSKAG